MRYGWGQLRFLGLMGSVLLVLAWPAAATPKPKPPTGEAPINQQVAIFAGGCFWCMEQPFDVLKGVLRTTSGYTGGHVANPSYKQVSAGSTGHYEAVKIEFDANLISYERLLAAFWRNIDPFDDKGQFCDKGEQYRSAIFYVAEAQKLAAQKSLNQLINSRLVPEPVATAILPAQTFYEAEDYHQNYYKKNPERYGSYRVGCRRDAKLDALWGQGEAH